jgi:hypothetical protein
MGASSRIQSHRSALERNLSQFTGRLVFDDAKVWCLFELDVFGDGAELSPILGDGLKDQAAAVWV